MEMSCQLPTLTSIIMGKRLLVTTGEEAEWTAEQIWTQE